MALVVYLFCVHMRVTRKDFLKESRLSKTGKYFNIGKQRGSDFRLAATERYFVQLSRALGYLQPVSFIQRHGWFKT